MFRKFIGVACTAMFLLFAAGASADPVSVVYNCELKDGKTKDDAMAVNARWLKWARATAGTDEITSSFVVAFVGDYKGFMWVDTYPSAAAWAEIADADTELDAEFEALQTCSSSRMYRAEETEPAK